MNVTLAERSMSRTPRKTPARETRTCTLSPGVSCQFRIRIVTVTVEVCTEIRAVYPDIKRLPDLSSLLPQALRCCDGYRWASKSRWFCRHSRIRRFHMGAFNHRLYSDQPASIRHCHIRIHKQCLTSHHGRFDIFKIHQMSHKQIESAHEIEPKAENVNYSAFPGQSK